MNVGALLKYKAGVARKIINDVLVSVSVNILLKIS